MFCNFYNLDIYVNENENVIVEILQWVRYIRANFGYFSKQPTIKSVFLSEKHLWFNLYESTPSFTFQYVFLNPFDASFFFLYPLKRTNQWLLNAKNVFLFNLTHPYVTFPNKQFLINASQQTYVPTHIPYVTFWNCYQISYKTLAEHYFAKLVEVSFNDFTLTFFRVFQILKKRFTKVYTLSFINNAFFQLSVSVA